MQARELDNYHFKGRITNSSLCTVKTFVHVSSWKYIQPKYMYISKDMEMNLQIWLFFFVIGWIGNKYFHFDLSELKIPPVMRNVDGRKEQRRQ